MQWNKKDKVLLGLVILCLISVISMTIVLIQNYFKTNPSFIAPTFDIEAAEGVPTPSAEYKYGIIDAMAYQFGICGNLYYKDGFATIFFTNLNENQVWLKVRIWDSNGSLLGESGLIRPGEYLEKVPLIQVPKNTEKIKIKVMSYEKDTYYSMGAVLVNATLIVLE